MRDSTHCFCCLAWHFGQWRSRQELYEIRTVPQASQESTWPPNAAVRQAINRRKTVRCSEETGWRAR